jgi:hypothetical protein
MMDVQNPRFDVGDASQRSAIHAMVLAQDEKLYTLAKDIVDVGLNPAELMIVMADEDDATRYVVLEGNRRTAALKYLLHLS